MSVSPSPNNPLPYSHTKNRTPTSTKSKNPHSRLEQRQSSKEIDYEGHRITCMSTKFKKETTMSITNGQPNKNKFIPNLGIILHQNEEVKDKNIKRFSKDEEISKTTDENFYQTKKFLQNIVKNTDDDQKQKTIPQIICESSIMKKKKQDQDEMNVKHLDGLRRNMPNEDVVTPQKQLDVLFDNSKEKTSQFKEKVNDFSRSKNYSPSFASFDNGHQTQTPEREIGITRIGMKQDQSQTKSVKPLNLSKSLIKEEDEDINEEANGLIKDAKREKAEELKQVNYKLVKDFVKESCIRKQEEIEKKFFEDLQTDDEWKDIRGKLKKQHQKKVKNIQKDHSNSIIHSRMAQVMFDSGNKFIDKYNTEKQPQSISEEFNSSENSPINKSQNIDNKGSTKVHQVFNQNFNSNAVLDKSDVYKQEMIVDQISRNSNGKMTSSSVIEKSDSKKNESFDFIRLVHEEKFEYKNFGLNNNIGVIQNEFVNNNKSQKEKFFELYFKNKQWDKFEIFLESVRTERDKQEALIYFVDLLYEKSKEFGMENWQYKLSNRDKNEHKQEQNTYEKSPIKIISSQQNQDIQQLDLANGQIPKLTQKENKSQILTSK